MNIYDIPNIEHCDVEVIGTIGHRLFAHEGWYIHKSTDPMVEDENGVPSILYRTVVFVNVNEDYNGVEITAAEDLPDQYIICGTPGNNDHEVM